MWYLIGKIILTFLVVLGTVLTTKRYYFNRTKQVNQQISQNKTKDVNRKISEFTGDNLIIGCSASHKFCNNPQDHDPSHYYSLDFDPEHKPDLVCDATKKIPESLLASNRFSFIIFENIDNNVFLDPKSKALFTAASCLRENGVVLLSCGLATFEQQSKPFPFLMKIKAAGFNYAYKIETDTGFNTSNIETWGISLLFTKNKADILLDDYDPLLRKQCQVPQERLKITLKPIDAFIEQMDHELDAFKTTLMEWRKQRREQASQKYRSTTYCPSQHIKQADLSFRSFAKDCHLGQAHGVCQEPGSSKFDF